MEVCSCFYCTETLAVGTIYQERSIVWCWLFLPAWSVIPYRIISSVQLLFYVLILVYLPMPVGEMLDLQTHMQHVSVIICWTDQL